MKQKSKQSNSLSREMWKTHRCNIPCETFATKNKVVLTLLTA